MGTNTRRQKIIQRQKKWMDKGFELGKLLSKYLEMSFMTDKELCLPTLRSKCSFYSSLSSRIVS